MVIYPFIEDLSSEELVALLIAPGPGLE